MKAAKNNQGGQADLYKMIESYMNGGMIKKYAAGGMMDGSNGVVVKHSGRDTPGFFRGSKETRYDEQGNETGSFHNRSKLARLLGLAEVKAEFHEGGIVHEHPHTDPPRDPWQVSYPFETQKTVSAAYRKNEGLKEAVSPGKIDAYNFSLPSSGLLEDLDEETKNTLRNSEFGKQYLSGEGSIDDQYNAYATKAIRHMSENPTQALSAINEMIESGNKNFQGLKGKTDEEKLKLATSYMTDKKIGDFHGALELTETEVPLAGFYTSTSSNIRGPQNEIILTSVGQKAIPEGAALEFSLAAKEAGVDVSSDTPAARRFFEKWTDEHGSKDITRGNPKGKHSAEFIDYAKEGLAATNQRSSQAATDTRTENQKRNDEQKLAAQLQRRAAEQSAANKAANRLRYDGQGRRIIN